MCSSGFASYYLKAKLWFEFVITTCKWDCKHSREKLTPEHKVKCILDKANRNHNITQRLLLNYIIFALSLDLSDQLFQHRNWENCSMQQYTLSIPPPLTIFVPFLFFLLSFFLVSCSLHLSVNAIDIFKDMYQLSRTRLQDMTSLCY